LCKCNAAGVQGKRRDEFAAGIYGKAERPLYRKWCKNSSLYHTKKDKSTIKAFQHFNKSITVARRLDRLDWGEEKGKEQVRVNEVHISAVLGLSNRSSRSLTTLNHLQRPLPGVLVEEVGGCEQRR
jgi:hypothetical protein